MANVGLINAPLNSEHLPSKPPMKIAYWHAITESSPYVESTKIFDFDLSLYQHLDYTDEHYYLLNYLCGGLAFSPPGTLKIKYNEYIFETFYGLDFLLWTLFSENNTHMLELIIQHKFGENTPMNINWNNPVKKYVNCLNNFAEMLCNLDLDILIMHMRTPSSVVAGLALLNFVKKINPEIVTVVGGDHVNIPNVSRVIAELNLVNALLCLDDEIAVKAIFSQKQIVKNIIADKKLNLPNVQWLSFKNKNFVGPSKGIVFKDLDRLPMPDYSSFKLTEYPLSDLKLRAVLFETARGCPFRCNFCNTRKTWTCQGEIIDVIRMKSLRRINAEAKLIADYNDIDEVIFDDPTLNLNSLRFDKVLKIFGKLGLSTAGNLRADLLTFSQIKSMKRNGFLQAIIGIESLSPNAIKLFGKGSSEYAGHAIKMVPLLLKNGIVVQLNLLIGHPYGSPRIDYETVQALKVLKRKLDREQLPLFNVYVGVICLNFGSDMYFNVLNDINYKVSYMTEHPVLREIDLPEHLKTALCQIPYVAIRTEKSRYNVDKVSLASQVYNLWSAPATYLKFIFKALEYMWTKMAERWIKENVAIEVVGNHKLNVPQIRKGKAELVSHLLARKRVTARKLLSQAWDEDRVSRTKILFGLERAGLIKIKPNTQND
jgi:hypothetical protein